MNLMRNIAATHLTAAQRREIFQRQILLERDRLEQLHAKMLVAVPEDHDLIEDALKLRLDAGEIANLSAVANGSIDDFLVTGSSLDDDPDKPMVVMAWSDIEEEVQGTPPVEAAAAHLADLAVSETPITLALARKIIHQAKVEAIREFRATLADPSLAYGQVPLMSAAPIAPQMAPPVVAPAVANTVMAVSAGPSGDDEWARLKPTEAAARFIDHNPRTGGADGQARKKGSTWTAKTREQFKLPALLLEQVMEGRPLAQIRQKDLL